MKNVLSIFVLVCSLAFAQSAIAETLVRTSDQYELPKGQVIEGNFLGVANPVSVAGDVAEDATLIGNRVKMTGTVSGDLLAFGILTDVTGVVEGDVRIVSGDVTVTGAISGDLVVLGGSVDISSSAEIEGDVVLYGGSAAVSGSVGGNVIGSVRTLTLDAPVAGGVDVHVVHLSLGSNASVTEAVRYTSSNLLSQSIDATIGGSVLRNDPILSSEGVTINALIMPFVMLLFSSWLWLFMSKKTLIKIVTQTAEQLPRSAVTGVVSLLVFPLIVFVLFLSVLGTYVALVSLIAYTLLLLLSISVLPAVIGFLCLKASNLKGAPVSAVSILIGVTICSVLLLLPKIGIAVLFFITVVVFGGLVEAVIKSGR